MGNGRAPRCYLHLSSYRWAVGYHHETCPSLYQLQILFHCQLVFKHIRGCGDSVSANGKDMGSADVAQIQGCYFRHVLDGRLVRDTFFK